MHKLSLLHSTITHPPLLISSSSQPPILPPSPQKRVSTTDPNPDMLLSVFLALFLPCVGMCAVFTVYICLLWNAARNSRRNAAVATPRKPMGVKGLSAEELEKLPKVTGKDMKMGNECAVCLDDVGEEQPVRLVPGCNHGFHLECADTWLFRHSVCPVCRSKIDFSNFALFSSTTTGADSGGSGNSGDDVVHHLG